MNPIDPNLVWYQDLASVLGVLGFIVSLGLAFFEVKKRIEDQKPQLTYFIRQRENEVSVAEIVFHNSGGGVAYNITVSTCFNAEEDNKLNEKYFFAKNSIVKINCLPPNSSIVFPFMVGFSMVEIDKPICLTIKYAENNKTNIRKSASYKIGVDELAPILQFSIFPSSRRLHSGVEQIAENLKKIADERIKSVYVISQEEKAKIDQEKEDKWREAEKTYDQAPDKIEEK